MLDADAAAGLFGLDDCEDYGGSPGVSPVPTATSEPSRSWLLVIAMGGVALYMLRELRART